MQFIWSDAEDENYIDRELWKYLKLALSDDDGLSYHRYPILSTDRSQREPDFLILHRDWGLFVINCIGCEIDNIREINDLVWEMEDWHSSQVNPLAQAEDQMWAVLGKFRKERSLRENRQDVIQGHIFIALPFVSRSEFREKGLDGATSSSATFLFADDFDPIKLRNRLQEYPSEEKQDPLTDEQWGIAKGILQGTSVLKREPRPESKSDTSKSALLRKVEQQMLSLDREQHSLAIQIPPGPQRIRGLSGSGKTIVMCMKAAWMHLRFPQWDIVYTFYTRSLYAMIKSLITRFYRYWAEQDPNWDKIQIFQGWGGKAQPGLYSTVATEMKITPRNYSEARNVFSYTHFNELLGKCCEELLKSEGDIPKLFDAIFIDEGQDFHFSFYNLCLGSLKDPKRLIWAYDEVQSLESLSIPTSIDIFGTNNDGLPNVNLEGTYSEGEIEKDVILYRCYRTPRPILVAAHVFGMGLLRPEGAVQFIPSSGGWEDIGYEIVSGAFTPGELLTIKRPEENSPHILEKICGYSELIECRAFSTRDDEINWVADQIYENINDDELKPEEILVITFDWRKMGRDFTLLEHILREKGVESIRPGYGSSRSQFQQKGFVTLSGIFPAKGNEASVVYLIGFEQIGMNEKIIVQSRNQAFTAMTRTRGWVMITGIGERAEHLFIELENILEHPDEITFTVPDPTRIQRNLDNLEYERRRNRLKEAERLTTELRRLLFELDDPEVRKKLLSRLTEKS